MKSPFGFGNSPSLVRMLLAFAYEAFLLLGLMDKLLRQKHKHWLAGLAAVALMVLGLIGCSTRKSERDIAITVPIIDGLVREIRIQALPKRIISLAPSITEMLFALGLGERIVGVTSYCDFPVEAKRIEKVGDTLNPNLERLIALKPDLVVITTASQLERLSEQLSRQGIHVYVVNPQTVREVALSIFGLGMATGTSAQGKKIQDDMLQRIASVEARVESLPKPKVLYVLQAAPLITAGQKTFITDLIRLAGGQSITGDEPMDYPQLSRETAIARAPEVIVAPASHGTELVKEEASRKDLAATPALKMNRIVRVNPDWVDRPGPRIVDGLEQLAEGLHPSKK